MLHEEPLQGHEMRPAHLAQYREEGVIQLKRVKMGLIFLSIRFRHRHAADLVCFVCSPSLNRQDNQCILDGSSRSVPQPKPLFTTISKHNAFLIAPFHLHPFPPAHLHNLPPLRHLPILLTRATTPPQRRPRTLRTSPTFLNRRLQHSQTYRRRRPTPFLHTKPAIENAPANQPVSIFCAGTRYRGYRGERE